MKKSLLALGVMGTFAGAAHAQNSVTLYGLIDAGITYTNNQGGSKNVQATSGGATTGASGAPGGFGWESVSATAPRSSRVSAYRARSDSAARWRPSRFSNSHGLASDSVLMASISSSETCACCHSL